MSTYRIDGFDVPSSHHNVDSLSAWSLWVVVIAVLMFAGYAVNEYPEPIFRAKVALFFVAAIFGYIVQSNAAKWDGLASPPASAKLLATVSMLLWIGMILISVEVPAFIACI